MAPNFSSCFLSRIFLLILSLAASPPVFSQFSLQQPFEVCGLQGSITLYDYQQQKWISSDIGDSQVATLPASTFKIVNTLIVLESGVIKDEHELIPWIDDYDTLKYGHRPNIYHSMSMAEAFRLSAGWVYVELAKRIGKDHYESYLSQIGYGNGDLSIPEADFWNFGPFAVTPADQIEVLIHIYEENLPFSPRSFQVLKKLMIEEETETYLLRGKTGWTRAGGKDTGWWVGYLEKADNVYFFATRLIKDRNEPNPNFGRCRKEITRAVFRNLGIL